MEIAPSGKPFFKATLLRTSNIARLEYMALLPPLKIIALPAFKQSPMQSLVTLGLDS